MPFGTRPPRRWNFSGALEKLDDFLQVVLDAFQPGHVGKRDGLAVGLVALGRTLAEAAQDSASHELVAGAANHDPHEPEEQRRADHVSGQQHQPAVGRGVGFDFDLLFAQLGVELCQGFALQRNQHDGEIAVQFRVDRLLAGGSAGLDRGHRGRHAKLAVHLIGRDKLDLLDVVAVQFVAEEAVRDLAARRAVVVEPEERHQQREQQDDPHARRTHARPHRRLRRLRGHAAGRFIR